MRNARPFGVARFCLRGGRGSARMRGMELFGPPYTVETVEEGGELGFHFRSKTNWTTLLFLMVAIGFFVYGFVQQSWSFALFSLLLICQTIWSSLNPTDQWLRATSEGVIASGERIRWPEIRSLRYHAGGEDESSCLAIDTGAGTRKLFTGIDEEECRQIVTAIYRRFPYAEMADDPGPPTIFGKWSELTTLGLSAKRPGDDGR